VINDQFRAHPAESGLKKGGGTGTEYIWRGPWKSGTRLQMAWWFIGGPAAVGGRRMAAVSRERARWMVGRSTQTGEAVYRPAHVGLDSSDKRQNANKHGGDMPEGRWPGCASTVTCRPVITPHPVQERTWRGRGRQLSYEAGILPTSDPRVPAQLFLAGPATVNHETADRTGPGAGPSSRWTVGGIWATWALTPDR